MAAKRLPRLNGFRLLSVLIGVLLLVSISFTRPTPTSLQPRMRCPPAWITSRNSVPITAA